MSRLEETIGSNYLTKNDPREIYFNDDEVVEDMLKRIRADRELLHNWRSVPYVELRDLIDQIGDQYKNHYSMNEYDNPWGDANTRVASCIERVWEILTDTPPWED